MGRTKRLAKIRAEFIVYHKKASAVISVYLGIYMLGTGISKLCDVENSAIVAQFKLFPYLFYLIYDR